MTYKEHTIVAECVTARAVYHIDGDGELAGYSYDIDTEPEVECYGIQNSDGDYLDWKDSVEEAKQFIDRETA